MEKVKSEEKLNKIGNRRYNPCKGSGVLSICCYNIRMASIFCTLQCFTLVLKSLPYPYHQ